MRPMASFYSAFFVVAVTLFAFIGVRLQLSGSHIRGTASSYNGEMNLESHETLGMSEEVLAAWHAPQKSHRILHRPQAIMVPGTKAIYSWEDGKKRLIPDWDTFCTLGYDMASVKYISAQEMEQIPTGDVLHQVTEAGRRDYSAPCPCQSRSRQPFADAMSENSEASLNKKVRNICILKNAPFDELFTEVYELNMLEKHMRFYLVDEEHISKDEIARWRLYDASVSAYTETKGDYSNKYTDFPTVGSFEEADARIGDGAISPEEAQKQADAAAAAEEEQRKKDANALPVYDSDVSPYPSPYFSNGHTTRLQRSRKLEETDEHGNISCDVIVEIMPDGFDLASHVCPGVCQPHPRLFIPKDALLPKPKHADRDITCSLTLSHVFADSQAEAGAGASDGGGEPLSETNSKEEAHARLAMILHSVSRRKMEECAEREYWMPPAHNRLNVETTHYQANYIEDPPKKKVRGLIIWVGSLSRFSLARAQIEVLKSQADLSPNDRIVGWLATEEIYNCRIGTTTCTTLSPNLAYFNYMPTSSLNVKNAGYNCAQRRPLRAIAHTLHLFDPDFLFVVDDDTWVNIDKLSLGGPLDAFIREDMVQNPHVMGQLTAGKKITRHGFFYGGAGYLMGRNVIDRLTARTIMGPPNQGDVVRDPTQTSMLQVMWQAKSYAEEACPACVTVPNEAAVVDQSSAGWPDVRVELADARLVDACMNIMSEEHTCYPSDHAMSRCLIHGAYANVINTGCEGINIHSSGGDVIVGMCMGIDKCGYDRQLTCHRWMADPEDYKHPVPNAWTETDED